MTGTSRPPNPGRRQHAALTWFADAGVPVRVLRRIAGHGSLSTTQRYLHPDVRKVTAAGTALSARFNVLRTPRPLPGPVVMPPLTWPRTSDLQLVPNPVPENDQEPVSDCSETGPDLRLSPVGTTGFEPATP
ncbi:hypothetical protein ACF1D2_01595 [Streptomyces bacillaris]|uniref:hypothetical protein n=1 Tax=Streptomyces bacillaris TaxID=68179 RepID=UPI0036F774BF